MTLLITFIGISLMAMGATLLAITLRADARDRAHQRDLADRAVARYRNEHQ